MGGAGSPGGAGQVSERLPLQARGVAPWPPFCLLPGLSWNATPGPAPPWSAVLPAVPLLGASPSPRQYGLCVQGLTPASSVQGRPHHQRPPAAQHPFPGTRARPTPSPTRRFQVSGSAPTAPPGRQVPRATRRTRCPRQTKSFFHHVTGDSPHSEEKGWWSRQK